MTTHRRANLSCLLALSGLGVLLPTCTKHSVTIVESNVDFSAAGDFAVAAPTHEDWAAGLRVGAGIVQEKDQATVGYVWLMRTPTGANITVTHRSNCQIEGTRGSVKHSSTAAARTVEVSLGATRQPGAPIALEVLLDGKVIDLTKGKVLLIDMRGTAPTQQVAMELPTTTLTPFDKEPNARAKTYAKDLLASLTVNPQVAAFANGK